MVATGQEDADAVMANLSGGTYKKVNSGHAIHLEQPDEFVRLVNEFFKT